MMYYGSEGPPDSITIRATAPEDEDALRRLAQRDTRAVPDGELLIALVNGEPRAAVSLASGEAIADPFHHTAELVRMLMVRRSHLRGEARRPRQRAAMPRFASDENRPAATIDRPCRSSSVG
jgi:hypothetical protein